MEQEEITVTVTVLGILPGDPPCLLTGERLSHEDKSEKLFQQAVPVPDTDLFARLTAQVSTGDTIAVTVVTEWYEDGYKTYLKDFALPLCPTQRPFNESWFV
jgi:hypothetical protein